jgi:hypothetical protein
MLPSVVSVAWRARELGPAARDKASTPSTSLGLTESFILNSGVIILHKSGKFNGVFYLYDL